MLDLFKTKTELIEEYCKAQHYFSSAMIEQYGQKIGTLATTAKRTLQHLCERGLTRRLTKEECLMRNFRGKMGWYEWIS